MPDAAPPIWSASTSVDAKDGRTLDPETIERILGDFRQWLHELGTIPTPTEEPPAVDMQTLVAQFTALRHEVNLQTKAARSTLEQNGEAIAELRSALEQLQDQSEADDGLDPLLKSIVDVYDNLALALRQVERQRDAIEGPLAEVVEGAKLPEPFSRQIDERLPTKAPSFWSWLLGNQATQSNELHGLLREVKVRCERTEAAAKLARSSFDSLLAGYRMSLARVDRVLEQYELTPILTEGETFDPELMEAVEVVGHSGLPAGTVIEEVRRGYIRGDVVFRYSQVKVAR